MHPSAVDSGENLCNPCLRCGDTAVSKCLLKDIPWSKYLFNDMSTHALQEAGGGGGPAHPSLPGQHDYNFLKTFCTAFETLNPGSIAKIYTPEVNDEERLMGFTCVSGHKSSASFERIFVHSLWMPALSSTNKTTSRHFIPCAPWIQTPT